MDLSLDDDQIALRNAAMLWIEDNLSLDRSPTDSAAILDELNALGWLSVTSAGVGLGHATEAVLFAELGKNLAPVGAMSTAIFRRWTDGQGTAALALGRRVFDPVGMGAAIVLTGECIGLIGISQTKDIPSLDPSTQQILLPDEPAIERQLPREASLHLRLLAAAFALGCAEQAGTVATDYARLREQFGQPIGAFQAIKHLCADAYVRTELARSQLLYAACAFDADAHDAAFHIAAAKRLADQAALSNARTTIQVHGGMGVTDEAIPHRLLKRAHLLARISRDTTINLFDDSK